MSDATPALRNAPGTGWCVFTGVLALLTALLPPVTGVFGLLCLVNAWRASRNARIHPQRYRGSAVPLAGVVLVLIAWSITALVVLVVGALSVEQQQVIHADPPPSERW